MSSHYDNEAVARLHEAEGRPHLARISRMDEQQLRDIVCYVQGAAPAIFEQAVSLLEDIARTVAEKRVSA